MLGLDQPRQLPLGQVDLAHVARDHALAAEADAGEEHLHLLGRGVLRLVEDHKGVVQGAPAHEGQGCNFERVALEGLGDAVRPHEVVERVVQGTQVGVNLLRQVAGQKAQLLAGLHRRAGEDDALHRATLEGVHRAGHRQVGLAGTGRADAEGDVVLGDVVQVHGLVGRARTQVGAPGLQHRRAIGCLLHGSVASEHELHLLRRDRTCRDLVQGLKQLDCALGSGLGAVDLELFVPVGNGDLQPRLNRPQVLVGGAAQVSQAGVVRRGKCVAQDQADNFRNAGPV